MYYTYVASCNVTVATAEVNNLSKLPVGYTKQDKLQRDCCSA
jgi:hypothetical protein